MVHKRCGSRHVTEICRLLRAAVAPFLGMVVLLEAACRSQRVGKVSHFGSHLTQDMPTHKPDSLQPGVIAETAPVQSTQGKPVDSHDCAAGRLSAVEAYSFGAEHQQVHDVAAGPRCWQATCICLCASQRELNPDGKAQQVEF